MMPHAVGILGACNIRRWYYRGRYDTNSLLAAAGHLGGKGR